jgi:formate dehydrogenase alpha subunit
VECLVVQDILVSELTGLAHIVLPGAAAAEKSGSVTSLDHRVSCLTPAVAPPGLARADGAIFADLFTRVSSRGGSPADKDAVGAEIKKLTPLYGDVCFPEPCGPCLKEPFRPQEKRLLYTPVDGIEAEKGLQLLTGKILFHFGTTSTFAGGCLDAAPHGYFEMHPEDAATYGIKDGNKIRVTSAIGSAQAPARINANVQPGLLFAPYHFADINVQQVIPTGQNRTAVRVEKS